MNSIFKFKAKYRYLFYLIDADHDVFYRTIVLNNLSLLNCRITDRQQNLKLIVITGQPRGKL